ncbi:TPA: hypothetical protein N0F65_011940 [Lagenidium giganteum]|uniref:PH domain-containing protein n=1 Tax=Lagenidium giganteum TaxID=4803 RepID=A0AAV2ZBI8_9STRA|nr:TPA: hypothetical protein N0F65_011940 [Lagenidium giganteum]
MLNPVAEIPEAQRSVDQVLNQWKAKPRTGFLRKRGEVFQNWKRRYFLLEDGVLSYKPDEKESTPVIKSAGVLEVITWGGRDHGLCIRLDNKRDLYVEAESERKRDGWYDALEAHAKLNQLRRMKEDEERRRNRRGSEDSEEED